MTNPIEITKKLKKVRYPFWDKWETAEESLQQLIDIHDEIMQHLEKMGEDAVNLYAPIALLGSRVTGMVWHYNAEDHRRPLFHTNTWEKFKTMADKIQGGAPTNNDSEETPS